MKPARWAEFANTGIEAELTPPEQNYKPRRNFEGRAGTSRQVQQGRQNFSEDMFGDQSVTVQMLQFENHNTAVLADLCLAVSAQEN